MTEAPALPVALAPPRTNKWLVALSVTFGTLMGTIDASIVNVAISHIRGTVGATVEEITWISTGFAIATVLVMPLTAFLGRLFGQKRVYLFALALFVVGSVLCGLARSLEALVAFRVIQGLGAGALQPTEQAILRQTFPPKEQGMAMALFAMAIMVGPAFGPTLGGWIVDSYPWPWIFFINVPVGILGFTMVTSFVEEPADIRAANIAMAEKQRKNIDWIGILLLTVGLSLLQYVLEEGNKNDWFDSPMIVGLTFASVAMLAALVIRELTAPVPAVDFSLFKDPVFLSGTLIGSVMFAMLMAVTFLLPLFMQEMLGFTATQSGLALMPRTLVMMMFTPLVGRLYNRIEPRVAVAIGIISFTFSTWLMSHYTLQTSVNGVILTLCVQGIGFSCLMVPLNTLALASIPRVKMADATGLNSLFRQIGGSIGLAIFATLLSRDLVRAKAALAMHVTNLDPNVADRITGIKAGLIARGLDAATAGGASEQMMAFIVARQAAVIAYEKIFLTAGLCFLAVLPLVWFLKRPKDQPAAAVPAEHVHVEV
ncbi:MAG: DHA2 family efflux MFS transporter permease subunit [Myxococcaceae bacterium]